jgi:predicted nucleic acid-binding protein
VIVADAAFVVAVLLPRDRRAHWAAATFTDEALLAPHLLPVEVTSVLRRTAQAGLISSETGALALEELIDLPITLAPYAPYAQRVWELRDNLTPYDAWYVAVAEAFDVPVATLDRGLARAVGPRCRFLVPPD